MPNQTIPITLQPGVGTPAQQAVVSTEAMAIIASLMSASIRADVSFFSQVTNDPPAFTTWLIYNVSQTVFKYWNIATGSYVAITQFRVGDMKTSFVGNDDVATGWVVLDGRLISNITGLTGAQVAALETLFGVGGSLPVVTPTNVSGLPPVNAFGNIPWPQILPAAGVFSGLTFSNPVADTEADAFAEDTEILRDTSENLFTLIKQIQALSNTFLNAMNNSNNPPIYSLVFCGYA